MVNGVGGPGGLGATNVAQSLGAASHATGGSSTTTVYDPRDTNRDKTVSYLEAVLYEVEFPAKSKSETGSTYGSLGQTSSQQLTSFLDVYA